MARINIEEESWQRLYRMAEFGGGSLQECVGIVCCLWHQSQDLLKTKGSKEEILEWSGLFKFSTEIQENYFFSLKKTRFISEQDSGEFLIHGNKIQIENRVSRQNKAAKGAKAIQKKWKKEKTLQALSKTPSSTLQKNSRVPQPLSESLSAVQFNAVQCNAVQGSAKQSNAEQFNLSSGEVEIRPSPDQQNSIPEISLKPEKQKPDRDANRKVFEAYREAYFARYQIEVVRNKTVNSQVSNLVKKLGEVDAIAVVRFYLTHNKSFYIQNTHTFGHCLSDAETLRTQMLKGKAITNTMVKSFEKTNATKELFDRFDEEWPTEKVNL